MPAGQGRPASRGPDALKNLCHRRVHAKSVRSLDANEYTLIVITKIPPDRQCPRTAPFRAPAAPPAIASSLANFRTPVFIILISPQRPRGPRDSVNSVPLW